MTDEELLKQLRQYPLRAGYALRLPAANRIEALMAERDEMKAEAHAHIEMWGKALRERDAALWMDAKRKLDAALAAWEARK